MLEIFNKENLIQRSKNMSPYFLDGLFSLKDIDIITDIRGYGMLGGIDIKFDERLGKYAFWFWVIGFYVDFMPTTI